MKNNEYTLESLKVLNPKFQPHGIVTEINDDDVNIVNTLIKHMERLRAITGKAVVGDSVRFTNENGTYYHYAMIDKIDNEVTICESPSHLCCAVAMWHCQEDVLNLLAWISLCTSARRKGRFGLLAITELVRMVVFTLKLL